MRKLLYITFCLLILNGCWMYSFTGASIHPDAKTFSVKYFAVNAPLADPNYGQILSESLKDLLLSQTRLDLQKEDGDIQYEGYVKNYVVTTSQASGNETASLNRLTITLNVKYTNTLDEEQNFESSFSRFVDFNSSDDFASLEQGLIEEINEQLIQDIFDKSLGNW
ncbi:MAG: LptE family protein [Flavobacteriales bacterium]|nr:LptE family protein [Flavobacteriales bacterium]